MKTPTSSLSGSPGIHHLVFFLDNRVLLFTTTAIELLAKRVWFRSLARIRRMRSASASPDTPAILSSPATRLPQDIVDMIIAHLIYDTRSLRACSLTCYSWYIASVPHLHHTLTTRPRRWYGTRGWPEPLQNASELGLLPLVKKFKHYGTDHMNPGFSPKRFNRRLLRQFSALTNVQELAIDDLDIPGSMPMLQRYFGHFLPTVRSLALKGPFGSRRQILYFIGLFEHLEDLTLIAGAYDPGKANRQAT
jgi:hypothetical protein